MNPYTKDYTDYFKTKELTTIHGEPYIDSLICIFSELKCNAQKIPTSLGGEKLGHLALILRATIYDLLPGAVPFISPVDSELLRCLSNLRLTGVEIATEKAANDESRESYYKVNVVKHTLRNQIMKSIEPECITGLRDVVTDMIDSSIPEIIYCIHLSLLA